MGRIQESFAALAAKKEKAYVGYALAGFPAVGADLALAKAVLESADLLEIGVPFSDPTADGVVLQRCSEKALAAGGGMERALELAKLLRQGSPKPLLLMTYLNPVLAMGLESFCHAAKAAGVDGLVIPDLPPEEGKHLAPQFKAAGLDLVYLAAPTSTPKRLQAIAKAATGFIYVVSVAGVTGERVQFDERLAKTVKELRRHTKAPLAIGFGISSPESARTAAHLADGVVVASTVLKAVLDAHEVSEGIQHARQRSAELSAAAKEA